MGDAPQKLFYSVEEYLELHRNAVDVLYRESKGLWQMRTYYGLDTSFELQTLGISISMRELYDRVTDLRENPWD